MAALQIHPMSTASQVPKDRLFVVASRAGDEVTALPGGVFLYAKNKLKLRSRTVTIGWAGEGATQTETTITVAAGEERVIGPFGLNVGGGLEPITPGVPITVRLTYPRNRGLRVFALSTT